MKRYYHHRVRKAVDPLRETYKMIYWKDLTEEQKLKVRSTFWYVEDRLPEGTYDSWLQSKGYFLKGYNELRQGIPIFDRQDENNA